MEELALSAYGTELRVVDTSGSGVCRRLQDALPAEFTKPRGPSELVVSFRVEPDVPAENDATASYRLFCDGIVRLTRSTEDAVLQMLQQRIDDAVARHSRQLLFVHAGVVGWRGLAIVIMGRSLTGKSTLVAELVRRGAVYYSDEFAVLDETGRVHPYARPLVLRPDEQKPRDLNLVWESSPRAPLAIGLIVATQYCPGSEWRPAVLRGARAALPLIDGAVLARQESEALLHIATRVAPGIVTLQGPRSEASDVAARVLDLIDDAFVSQSLHRAEEGPIQFAANLAAVAERRLRSHNRRPIPSPRQLLAARYLRITDFLAREEHERLRSHALACQDAFKDSGIIDRDGGDLKNYGVRKSRTLHGDATNEVRRTFEQRVRHMLSHVRRELGLAWFPVGDVEVQLTAHTSGGFFAPHTDTGHPMVADRRISCVYYFHRSPRRFTGGDLKLYDNWVTNHGSTAAATYTVLAPLDNSIVFFPSDTFHEVCPVQSETDAFGDSRFAVTIWVHEGKWPARMSGAGAGSAQADRAV